MEKDFIFRSHDCIHVNRHFLRYFGLYAGCLLALIIQRDQFTDGIISITPEEIEQELTLTPRQQKAAFKILTRFKIIETDWTKLKIDYRTLLSFLLEKRRTER